MPLSQLDVRTSIVLSDDMEAVLLPVQLDQIERTYRDGAHLVVALADGRELLLEGWFARLEEGKEVELLARDRFTGEIAAVSATELGVSAGADPVALGRLEEMFGAGPADIDSVLAQSEGSGGWFGSALSILGGLAVLVGGVGIIGLVSEAEDLVDEAEARLDEAESELDDAQESLAAGEERLMVLEQRTSPQIVLDADSAASEDNSYTWADILAVHDAVGVETVSFEGDASTTLTLTAAQLLLLQYGRGEGTVIRFDGEINDTIAITGGGVALAATPVETGYQAYTASHGGDSATVLFDMDITVTGV